MTAPNFASLKIKLDSTEVNKGINHLKSFNKEAKNTGKAIDNLNNKAKNSSKGFGVLEKSIFSVKNLIGTVLVGSVISFADEMTNLEARISNSTNTMEEAQEAFVGLQNIVMETGGSMAASVDVFQRLSNVRTELDATIDDMVLFTETVQKFGVVSGASTGALNAGLTQLGQAMSSDVTRAEEFNSIMENIPRVGKAIADELGVTTGQLRQLVIEGELLSEDVFQAIINQSAKAREEFEAMPMTMSRATGILINQFKVMVNEINKASGASKAFVSFIEKLQQATKAATVLVVGLIKWVETTITAAATLILMFINSSVIDTLNVLMKRFADFFNWVSDKVNSLSKGAIDLGEMTAKQFDQIGGGNANLKETFADEFLSNFNDVLTTTNNLFAENEEVVGDVKEITKDYAGIAEGLGDSKDKEAKKTQKVIDALKHQISLIGKTKEEQEILNNINKAGNNVTEEQIELITDLTKQRQDLQKTYDIEEYLEDLQFETEQLSRTAAEQEYYNKLREYGLELGDERAKQLKEEIDYHHKVKDAIEDKKEKEEEFKKAIEEVNDTLKEGIKDWIKGVKDFSDVIDNLHDKLLDLALNEVWDYITGGGRYSEGKVTYSGGESSGDFWNIASKVVGTGLKLWNTFGGGSDFGSDPFDGEFSGSTSDGTIYGGAYDNQLGSNIGNDDLLQGLDSSSLSGGGGDLKFSTGGSFTVDGNAGIDRNTLSLNGAPIANVSKGERIDVGKAGGAEKAQITNITMNIQTPDADSFRRSQDQIVKRMNQASAATMKRIG